MSGGKDIYGKDVDRIESRSGDWIETRVKYVKKGLNAAGKLNIKEVTELYVTSEFSFGQAEKTVLGTVAQEAGENATVLQMARPAYGEIVFDKETEDGRYYKVRLSLVQIDERSGKEKRVGVTYLVQGDSLESARKNTTLFMNGSMSDYEIKSVVETKVAGVLLPKE